MPSVPHHLRFLEDLRRQGFGQLADYYPEEFPGDPSDALFTAGGITYMAPDDGLLVPVDAQGLEPMQDNIWDANKLSALVDAAQAGENPHVIPGYAQLWMEDGEIHAQVRDGNHRTFAAILSGSDFSWVWISAATKQDLDQREPGTEKLYRAIRAAQRAHGAPQFQRRKWGKVKKGSEAALLDAERRYAELEHAIAEHYRNRLRRHGFPRSGFSQKEQLERPQVFWRSRSQELRKERGVTWFVDNIINTPESEEHTRLRDERIELARKLDDLREASGLQAGESLDPKTGQIVRANPRNAKKLKRKLMR